MKGLLNDREFMIEVGVTLLCIFCFWMIAAFALYESSGGIVYYRSYQYKTIDGVLNSFYRTNSMSIAELLCKGVLTISVMQLILAVISWRFQLSLMKVLTPVGVLCFLGILAQSFLNPAGLEKHLMCLALGTVAGVISTCLVNVPMGKQFYLWVCRMIVPSAIVCLLWGMFHQTGGNGAWILGMQPGEFFKVGSLLLTALGFHWIRVDKQIRLWYFAALLLMLLAVLGVKDLGNGIILTAIILICLATLGFSRLCALVTAFGCCTASVLYRIVMRVNPDSKIVQRVSQALFHPLFHLEDNGVNQNLRQALLALVRGGMKGTGVTGRNPLPAANVYASQTDFAFICATAIFGIIFSLMVLASLSVLVINVNTSLKRTGSKHADRYLANILVSVPLLQAIVHILGSISVIPMTGVVLPLISAGGSGTISTMACFGIILGYHLPYEIRTMIASAFVQLKERGLYHESQAK